MKELMSKYGWHKTQVQSTARLAPRGPRTMEMNTRTMEMNTAAFKGEAEANV